MKNTRVQERDALKTLRMTTALLIGDEWVEGDGEQNAVVNPASEETIAVVRSATPAQVDRACASAREAFESERWSNPKLRQKCLNRLADLMERDAVLLGALLTQEIGSPVANRYNQVEANIPFLRWFADAAVKDRKQILPALPGMVDTQNILDYRPLGVVAGILAYNYPLVLLVTKLGAIAAAGCTCVLMPSIQAPLAVLHFGHLIKEAGFPAGVVNIVVGGIETGRALTLNPDIDKVSFTGSVEVGRRIMEQAASGIRGVVLELGGKSAAIMLPGVDFSRYAFNLHKRQLQHAGQSCSSPTRYLVERQRIDEFIEVSRAAYAAIPIGDPWDPEVLVGPVISRAHRDRVNAFVDEAVTQGARVAVGGGRSKEPKGWYVNPALVVVDDRNLRIAREEIFGPVGVVIPYDSVDEAVAIANDSALGLKAYLFGSAAQCRALAPKLRVGTVVINGGAGARFDAPMGGFKQSGIGREWGEDGMREFLEPQHIDCGEAST
jgi:aldehyde dehydrogenase (NAD+)/betaine-aldehyde dehydrogenase